MYTRVVDDLTEMESMIRTMRSATSTIIPDMASDKTNKTNEIDLRPEKMSESDAVRGKLSVIAKSRKKSKNVVASANDTSDIHADIFSQMAPVTPCAGVVRAIILTTCPRGHSHDQDIPCAVCANMPTHTRKILVFLERLLMATFTEHEGALTCEDHKIVICAGNQNTALVVNGTLTITIVGSNLSTEKFIRAELAKWKLPQHIIGRVNNQVRDVRSGSVRAANAQKRAKLPPGTPLIYTPACARDLFGCVTSNTSNDKYLFLENC